MSILNRWPLRRTQPANLRPADRVEPEDWADTRTARTKIFLQTFANTFAPNTTNPPIFPSLGALTELCAAPTLPTFDTIYPPAMHTDHNGKIHMAWTDGASVKYLRVDDPTDSAEWIATPTTLTPPLTCYYTALCSTHSTLLLVCATLRIIYVATSTDDGATWSSFTDIHTTASVSHKIQSLTLALIPGTASTAQTFWLTWTHELPASLGPAITNGFSQDCATWAILSEMSDPYSAKIIAVLPVSSTLLHVVYEETSLVSTTTAHHWCAPVTMTSLDPNDPDVTYGDSSIVHIRYLIASDLPYTYDRCYLITLPYGASFACTAERSGVTALATTGTTFHPMIVPLHTLDTATYTEQGAPLTNASATPHHTLATRVHDVLYWILDDTVYTQSLTAVATQHPVTRFSASANTSTGAQFDITLPASADPTIGRSMRLARLLTAPDGSFAWRYTILLPTHIYRHRTHTRIIAVDAHAWLLHAKLRTSLLATTLADYSQVDGQMLNLLTARVGIPAVDEIADYEFTDFLASAGERAVNALQRLQQTASVLVIAHWDRWALQTIDPSDATELSYDDDKAISLIEVEDATATTGLQLSVLSGATADLGAENLIHMLATRHPGIRPIWTSALNYNASAAVTNYDTILGNNLAHLDNQYLQLTIPYLPQIRLLDLITVGSYEQASLRSYTEQWQNGRHTLVLVLHRV